MKCIVCKKEDIFQYFCKDDLRIVKCRNCALQFQDPQPTDEELMRIYEGYFQGWDGEKDTTVKQAKKLRFGKRVQEIKKFASGGKILDVGCAAGHFLEEAKKAGFDPYGIELSPSSCKAARKVFGDHIFEGSIENNNFEDSFFDIITMFDLFEHVRDPLATMHYCNKLLKHDGLLVATLPDTSSLSARLMRKRWFQYKKEHLYYFNKQNLINLLNQESFEVLEIVNAVKVFNLKYAYYYLHFYSNKFLKPLWSTAIALCPKALLQRPIYMNSGELLVIAKKI